VKGGGRNGAGWRTDKKSVSSFSKERSKNKALFASFLLFSEACLEATFYVIYLKIANTLELSTDEQSWRYSAPCLMSAGKDCSPSPSLLKLVMKLPVTSVKVVPAFRHLKAYIFQYADKIQKV